MKMMAMMMMMMFVVPACYAYRWNRGSGFLLLAWRWFPFSL